MFKVGFNRNSKSGKKQGQSLKMKIFVGSNNPVKINAVKEAVKDSWPNCEVVGFKIKSGVSDQPQSDLETKSGAVNRARLALAQGLNLLSKTKVKSNETVVVHLGVGLEGGVIELEDGMYSTVWASVVDESGYSTEVNGARFKIPQQVASGIRSGGEMGPVVAELSGLENVKSKQGLIGVLTNGFVNRTQEYSSIAKLALGIWHGRKTATATFCNRKTKL
jgi:inosine/xanthosine triphosphatase